MKTRLFTQDNLYTRKVSITGLTNQRDQGATGKPSPHSFFPISFFLFFKKKTILILLFPVIWPCWLLRLSCHQKDVRCTSVAFPGSTMRPCITPCLFHLVSLHTFPLTQLLPHPACQRQPSVISLRLQAISSTSMTAYVDVHRRGIVSFTRGSL